MPKIVEVPGFGEVEFPDGMSDDAIAAAIKKSTMLPANATDDFDKRLIAEGGRGTGMQNFLAGVGKGMTDVGRGITQLFVDRNNSERMREIQSEIDESRRRDAPLMRTGAGIAGNVLGSVASTAPAMFVPGINSLAGASAVGGALGFAQPVASDESRLLNTAIGTGGGALGNLIPRGVSRVLNPKGAPGVRALLDEGITPTPGQTLGGAAQRMEEGFTSVPIIGDAVKTQQRRAVEEFNRAAINRSLAPIGKKLPPKVIGNEAIKHAGDMLGQAYDDLLPKLNNINADQQFMGEITNLRSLAANLPDSQAKQFESLLNKEVLGKFTPAGRMSGETMKGVESKLGGLLRMYGRSENPDHRLLADAIKETQATVRSMVERTNPNYAGELQKINEGWANFVRVQNAAGRIGAKEGVFSPAALRGAVRATDSSVRKGKFARGEALMQDLAEAGEKVLGPKVPDSGTPFRTANMLTGIGGAMVDPLIPAGLLAGSYGLVNTPVNRALVATLARRPDAVRAIGEGVAGVAPYTGAAGALFAPAIPGLLGVYAQ